MPRKTQHSRKNEVRKILISPMHDGRIRLSPQGGMHLPYRKLLDVMNFGFIHHRQPPSPVVTLTLPQGKSWEQCRTQVIAILKCRGFVQGISEQGFAKSYTIDDNVSQPRLTQVIQVDRLQKQPPHRRRQSRPRKMKAHT